MDEPDSQRTEGRGRRSHGRQPWSDPGAAWLFRIAVATSVALAGAGPWIARAAIAVIGVGTTAPIDWVSPEFPARKAYADFSAEFQSGDVVVASWPGCVLDAPELDRFEEAAIGQGKPRDAAGRPWFTEVSSGTRAVERLVAPPLKLDRSEAIERLEGILVGPDGRRTCVVIGFSPSGLADRRQALAWIRHTLRETAGVADADLHLAGTVVENVAVDEASDDSMRFFGGPAAVIVFGLTWLALRSFRYALVVFLLSLYCVGLSFASLAFSGDRMNPVLIVLPLLVLTLGVSGGIHLVNYLVEEYRKGQGRGAAVRAVRMAWLPCLLSSGTTALGLFSLVVSELEPIRVFGFHGAVGVLGTLLVSFLVLPGIFARWPIRRRVEAVARHGAGVPWAGWVVRRAAAIVTVSVAILAATGAGAPGIRTSVGIDTLFPPGSRVVRDYAWLEREIGPLVPVEVLVRFDAGAEARPRERLDVVGEVGAALRTLPPVAGVLSADLFEPEPASASGARRIVGKVLTAPLLEQRLSGLDDMPLVRDADGDQVWRVTARISALAGLDYGGLLGDVRRVVAPVIERHGGRPQGLSTDITGAMPLVNAIQNALLRDLFTSFLSACCVITLVMMVVERGFVAGLLAMVPNVLPMILLFGALGWAGATLDIGSVMTASVALGMAVDGTFHFLTFFRRGLAEAGVAAAGRATAVLAAFRHSAGALLQSGLVCGLGILPFVPSGFAPTRRFALLLSLLVFAALVGDLVVLPAILTTRLGRWFRPARDSLRLRQF